MANLLDIMSTQDKDRYGHLVMPVDTNIQIESVILSDENKRKIEEFKEEMEHADELVLYGLSPMNRLLFYGASGCGKTYLAKALSNYLDYYMIYVDIAKALSDGSVSKSISDIFMLAEKYKRCILFFDECDSIAWNRDTQNGEGGVARRATNSIFQSLDQMSPSNVFIAATNMLHRLDAAFENRFNLKLEFRRPELTIEETARKFMTDRFELSGEIDDVAKATVDKRCLLSYRELRSIVEREMKKAVIRGDFTIPIKNLYESVAIQQKIKVRFGTAEDYE